MVGIDGTFGSVTGFTHRAEVTADNKLAVYATGSNGAPVNTNINSVTTYESGLVVMTHKHWRTNECLEYSAGSCFCNIPIDGSGGVMFDVGSIPVHFHMEARSDGDTKVVIMENIHVSDSGASINIFNRRRDCPDVINSKMWVNPTISAVGSGDVLYTNVLLGGSGADTKFASAPASTGTGDDDWILNNGSLYWIKFENYSGRELSIGWDSNMHIHKNSV